MQANLATIIEQYVEKNENVLANIKCSLQVFIYREVLRPGLLVATDKKLIFVADSIEGNELTEIYSYEKVENIMINSGLMNKSISMKYDAENVKFKHLMSNNVEQFIEEVQSILN